MKQIKVVFIIQCLVLLLGGCSGNDVVDAPQDNEDQNPATFTLSGFVLDEDEEGIPGVLLDFDTFGTATTGLDGAWSKSGLEGIVTITPSKEGWGFTPGSVDVDEETTDLTFQASPLITMLEILVEWDKVGNSDSDLSSLSIPEDDEGPTHFGTRLEYPNENAIFVQSLSREEANEFGLITMKLPTADRTDLFVTAVRLNEEGEGQKGQRDLIIWFGEIRDIEIVEGSSTTVRMVDVDWTRSLWDFEDEEVREAYDSGKMIGNKDETELIISITVRDPFGDRPWDDFIGLNGTGGSQTPYSEDGKWSVQVYCTNELVGQEHESRCAFWPYLKSEKFNLPDVRFSVPPTTSDFVAEWQ